MITYKRRAFSKLTFILSARGVSSEVSAQAVGRGVPLGDERVAQVRPEERARGTSPVRHGHHLDRQVGDVH